MHHSIKMICITFHTNYTLLLRVCQALFCTGQNTTPCRNPTQPPAEKTNVGEAFFVGEAFLKKGLPPHPLSKTLREEYVSFFPAKTFDIAKESR